MQIQALNNKTNALALRNFRGGGEVRASTLIPTCVFKPTRGEFGKQPQRQFEKDVFLSISKTRDGARSHGATEPRNSLKKNEIEEMRGGME